MRRRSLIAVWCGGAEFGVTDYLEAGSVAKWLAP